MKKHKLEKILLIQTAFIGDVILTTPMIAALKKHLPHVKLTVMVKPEAVSLLSNNPHLNDLIVIDKGGEHKGLSGMIAMIRQIRKRKFNVILSPHQSHRTGLISMFSGALLRVGYKSAGFALLAYNKRLIRHPEMPEIKRLLKFLDESIAPGTEFESVKPQLFETEKSKEQAVDLLSMIQAKKPILLAVSSVWPTKRWTPWGFAELAGMLVKKYKTQIILIGSKGDMEISRDVMNFVNLLLPENIKDKIHDRCGKTNLQGLYSLMKKSMLLVSNDSAPVHFASAANIPVVAVFGPTVASLGYAPISPNSAVAQLEDLECRPCGTHGARECPTGHFRCMKSLTANEVMEKVDLVVVGS